MYGSGAVDEELEGLGWVRAFNLSPERRGLRGMKVDVDVEKEEEEDVFDIDDGGGNASGLVVKSWVGLLA